MTGPWEEFGLTEREYLAIAELLGRNPDSLELAVFGVMWSEHCSYKHTRQVLRRFPTRGRAVLQGPGENAGVVQLSPQLAVAFKVESHNHPSALDPYAGAATGVGGVVRDVAALGAEPLLVLTSLRLGPAYTPRARHLGRGALDGAMDYTRGLGIVGARSDLRFSPCYRGNPLVNAMALGQLNPEQLVTGAAPPGDTRLVVLGAGTDRQGVAAASFASEELSEEEAPDQVPTGDPELERRLLLACGDLVAQGKVRGMQDLGAGGVASAAVEMADRGRVGLRLDLDQLPVRVEGLTAREMLLAETQERMLLAVAAEDVAAVGRAAEAHDLAWGAVGQVMSEPRFLVECQGQALLDLPVEALTAGVPIPSASSREPGTYSRRQEFVADELPEPEDYRTALLALVSHPDLAWRCQPLTEAGEIEPWLKEPGLAVMELVSGEPSVAVALGVNARRCHLDPEAGGAETVALTARRLACLGAHPLAFTDGLNFGNPENPEVFWQLEQMVEGMSRAAEELETPVVSGNVSAYNQSPHGTICPTPVVGMVGSLPPGRPPVPSGWQQEGDIVLLLGPSQAGLEGSAYLAHLFGTQAGALPAPDLEGERLLQGLLREASSQGLLASAVPVAEGGVLSALVGASLASGRRGLGARVEAGPGHRPDRFYFGEGGPRALASLPQARLARLQNLAVEHGLEMTILGRVEPGVLEAGVHEPGGSRQVLLQVSWEELREAVTPVFRWLEEDSGEGGPGHV